MCRTNVEGGKCASPNWKIEEVEDVIFRHLKEIDLGSLVNKDVSRLEHINEAVSVAEQFIANCQIKIDRTFNRLIEGDWSEEISARFSNEIKLEESLREDKKLELEKLISEKNELVDGMSLMNTEGFKSFIEKYNENRRDYEFRSSINELLRKTIIRIELLQRDSGFDPTEYTDKSNEVISYRLRSTKAMNLPLDEIIIRPTFKDHCKWLEREIYIKYKYDEMRYIDYRNNFTAFFKKPRITPKRTDN